MRMIRKGKVSGYFRIVQSFYVCFLWYLTFFCSIRHRIHSANFMAFFYFIVLSFSLKIVNTWYVNLFFLAVRVCKWKTKTRRPNGAGNMLCARVITTSSLLECYTFSFSLCCIVCSLVCTIYRLVNVWLPFCLQNSSPCDALKEKNKTVSLLSISIFRSIDVGAKERQINGFLTCFMTFYFSNHMWTTAKKNSNWTAKHSEQKKNKVNIHIFIRVDCGVYRPNYSDTDRNTLHNQSARHTKNRNRTTTHRHRNRREKENGIETEERAERSEITEKNATNQWQKSSNLSWRDYMSHIRIII